MAHYWIVRTPGGEVEGPYTAAQLHELVDGGAITAETLVSNGGEWHPATTVRGLMPAAAGPAHEAGAEATPCALEPGAAAPPPAAATGSSSLYAPGGAGAMTGGPPTMPAPVHRVTGPTGRPRRLGWLVALCAALCAFTLVTSAGSVIHDYSAGYDYGAMDLEGWEAYLDTPFNAWDWAGCCQVIAWLALFVYYLVWIYTVHREIEVHTGGAHTIGPGLALGLSFVPLFNLVWRVYMPARLAQTIEQRGLEVGIERTVAPVTVIVLLILSCVPGCCLWPGLSWLLISIAMLKIQNGLNALWLQGTASP